MHPQNRDAGVGFIDFRREESGCNMFSLDLYAKLTRQLAGNNCGRGWLAEL
jgi:hypothetical protein